MKIGLRGLILGIHQFYVKNFGSPNYVEDCVTLPCEHLQHIDIKIGSKLILKVNNVLSLIVERSIFVPPVHNPKNTLDF